MLCLQWNLSITLTSVTKRKPFASFRVFFLKYKICKKLYSLYGPVKYPDKIKTFGPCQGTYIGVSEPLRHPKWQFTQAFSPTPIIIYTQEWRKWSWREEKYRAWFIGIRNRGIISAQCNLFLSKSLEWSQEHGQYTYPLIL